MTNEMSDLSCPRCREVIGEVPRSVQLVQGHGEDAREHLREWSEGVLDIVKGLVREHYSQHHPDEAVPPMSVGKR